MITQPQFHKFLNEFIECYRSKINSVCDQTIDLVENSKQCYIDSNQEFPFSNLQFRQWFKDTVLIKPRPDKIKSVDALERKLKNTFPDRKAKFWTYFSHGIPVSDSNIKGAYKTIFENINDLTGVEVIFPSSGMIHPFKQGLLKLIIDIFAIAHPTQQDYLSNIQPDGYRAYHVFFPIDGVNTEIQLKTHMAKCWEYYSHDLFYKNSSNDKRILRLINRLKMMANMNSLCENLGTDILEELSSFYLESDKKELGAS